MATMAQITKQLAANPKARQALGAILKKAEIEGDLGNRTPTAGSYAQALWDYIKDNPDAVAAAAMPIAGAGIGAATGRRGTRGRRALAGAGIGAGAGAGLMVLSRLVDSLRSVTPGNKQPGGTVDVGSAGAPFLPQGADMEQAANAFNSAAGGPVGLDGVSDSDIEGFDFSDPGVQEFLQQLGQTSGPMESVDRVGEVVKPVKGLVEMLECQ